MLPSKPVSVAQSASGDLVRVGMPLQRRLGVGGGSAADGATSCIAVLRRWGLIGGEDLPVGPALL